MRNREHRAVSTAAVIAVLCLLGPATTIGLVWLFGIQAYTVLVSVVVGVLVGLLLAFARVYPPRPVGRRKSSARHRARKGPSDG